MTPDQHTIAELQELVEHLRDKLADAESCCAAQRAWIDATFENCSVFSDPPKFDAGKDYVHRKKLEEEKVRLREALKKYGSHAAHCIIGISAWEQCDCGLAAALKEDA